jgi:hypothetical protein
MTSTCTQWCMLPPLCELNYFAGPCICMVSMGGVAPTITATQFNGNGQAAAEQGPQRVERRQ